MASATGVGAISLSWHNTDTSTVRYQIERSRLHSYLFEVRDPEAMIRSAAESVLRESVASRRFNTLATTEREAFHLRRRLRWTAAALAKAVSRAAIALATLA